MFHIQVNWAFFTPSVIALIQPSEVPSLKTVAVGGEIVTQDCVDTWASKVKLFNAYGPTECCIFCLVSPIYPGSEPANIGYGVGSRPWIVSPRDHHKICPVDSVGELLIEGKILSRGYLNDPDKTDSAFVAEPKWSRNLDARNRPRRLYKTGDLARYNMDGSITCLGRKDRQVKIRGQRIEPGEIESRIKQHLGDAITHAVVDISLLGVQKSSQVLTAFLAFDQTQVQVRDMFESLGSLVPTITAPFQNLVDTLESFLSKSLPVNMVPAIFIPLTALPKTISGKVDRARLQMIADDFSTRSSSIPSTANAQKKSDSCTKIQLILRKEWSILLGIPETSIGLNDRFFALGGNSILAIKLVSAACRQGLRLAVADLFRNPSLSDMVTMVREPDVRDSSAPERFSMLGLGDHQDFRTIIDAVADQCQVSMESIQDVYPCTPFQESLMAVSADQIGLYTGRFTFELPENIDINRFRAAWSEVNRQINTLRTRIVDIPTIGYVQVVIDEDIDWLYAKNLADYCLLDSKLTMTYGGKLTRYAMAEQNGRTWFVWTVHHSLYDGWCLPKYLEVLSELYIDNRKPLDITVPFQQFVHYLQKSFVKDDSSAFWRSAMDNVSSSQFPRLPSPTYEPRISESVTVKAVLFDRTMPHITTAMLIQAAWALVVAQHTGSTDVTFGSAVTGRNVPLVGIDSVAGPTLATVPVRITIDYGCTIGSFLETILERATAMMPREQDGLQRIKQASESARNACNFQTIFVVQPDQGHEAVRHQHLLHLANHQVENINTQSLALECIIEKDVLSMEAQFDSDVITSTLIQRLLNQWRHVVQQLAGADADQSLRSLSFISPEDIQDLQIWNAVVPPPIPGFVHDQISMWAKLQPQTTAICSWEGNMTYEELEDFSSRLACLLIACGVGPESIVPLYFNKGIPVVVAMMGVLKAGAAFVPLDYAAPDARIKEILTQVDATVVLMSNGHSNLWPLGVRNIIVDWDLLLTLPKRNWPLAVDLKPHHLAYLIMTSGSTGKPKGVMIEHSSLSSSVEYHGRYYGLGRESRVLQFASLAFDAAVGDVVATIVHGGCLVMPHTDVRLDNLTQFINETRVNWSFFTPSTLKTFQPSDVPTIETLVVGGEAITDECIDTWAGEVHLINGYGPSETTIACAAASVSPDGSNRGSIGRGLGCLTWVVALGDHDSLAPIGSVGELVIQGPIVGRGYLDNEDQTLAAFIENPLWLNTETRQPVRMYKTGDLVYYNDDGTLQYVGRKDSQVKIRGQRVELGEIESCVQSNEFVEHATVVYPVSGGSKEHLVAFLTLSRPDSTPFGRLGYSHIQLSNQKDTAGRLDKVRNSLAEQLPSYMIPTYWVVIDRMPTTTSGKTDRKGLTRWIENLTYSQCKIYRLGNVDEEVESLEQPSSPRERLLQNIWADVLNVPSTQIGVNRSFLTMGGDSLMAMQALRRCRIEGLRFHVRNVLQGQTITQLARTLEPVKALPALQDEKNEHLFDLSPIQQMYAVAAPRSERHHFNQSQRFRLKHRLEYDALYHALGAVVRRHSMLRARFVQSTDRIVAQYICNDAESSYCVRVHSRTDPRDMNEAMARSQYALDVKDGPVISADIFNSGPTDASTLFLVAHHLVVDNVSWGIILDDLKALLREGRISGSAPLPFQTWCTLQKEYFQQKSYRREKVLDVVPPTNLDYWGVQRSQITYGAVAREKFVFDDAQSEMLLGNFHGALHTELMDLFVAAILASFQQIFSDRCPPAVFTEAHGRESFRQDVDPSNTVGWFTTLCPNFVETENGESPKAILKRVKDIRRRIRSNGWDYFSSRFLHPEGRGTFSDRDLPEIVFNNTGMSETSEPPDSLLISDPDSIGDVGDMSPNMPRFALMDITASHRHGRLEFEWLFSPNMRHAEKIVPWMQRCMHVLEQMALSLYTTSPEYTLTDFPLMPMTNRELDLMLNQTLPESGLCVPEEIETFYPGSPIQEAILTAQASSPRYFRARLAFEVKLNGTSVVDINRLSRAWQLVVDHHPILRTVSVPSPSNDQGFVQVVIKTYMDATRVIEGSPQLDEQPLRLPPTTWKPNEPHHKMTMWKDRNQKIVCCWDVSHALIDHASMSILFEDLSRAYDSEKIAITGRPYADLISHLQSTPSDVGLGYWKTYLCDSAPCRLASKAATPSAVIGELQSTDIDLVPLIGTLKSVTHRSGVTMANVFRLAWALLLCHHLRAEDVTFGYLVSGRDIQIPNVDRIVGPLINILACRFKNPSRPIATMLNALQNDFLESLQHQQHLLSLLQSPQTNARLGVDGLFDTLVNFRRHTTKAPLHMDGVLFEPMQDEDPFNVGCLLPTPTPF